MTDGPADALRAQAREWGQLLLAGPIWSTVLDRVTLLLVSPPVGIDTPVPATTELWLMIDTPTARSLPPELRTPLATDQPLVEDHRATATAPAVHLVIHTEDGVHRLLQGLSQRAIEARWQVRHAEALSDRLRRLEQFALRAGMIPADGPERLTRTLWLDLVAAARGLDVLPDTPGHGLAAAGEVSASMCRLACAIDEGAYPPAAYLRAAASETRIGRRLGTWLDDLVAAVGGDEAATRRVLSSRAQALEEVRTVLGEQYRDRPWLRTPEAFALRAPR